MPRYIIADGVLELGTRKWIEKSFALIEQEILFFRDIWWLEISGYTGHVSGVPNAPTAYPCLEIVPIGDRGMALFSNQLWLIQGPGPHLIRREI